MSSGEQSTRYVSIVDLTTSECLSDGSTESGVCLEEETPSSVTLIRLEGRPPSIYDGDGEDEENDEEEDDDVDDDCDNHSSGNHHLLNGVASEHVWIKTFSINLMLLT